MSKIKLRTYQQRVINQLTDYLENDSIHIVAPPGSGKTILGITIIEKIKKKTLILVPSLLLKHQWIEAIQHFYPQWETSESLLQPAEITVTTYQDLYSKGEALRDYFEEQHIRFLVLDESHHLKKNWSDFLLDLKNQTTGLQLLALTATPPFDASQKDWHTYIQLTGAIDEEVSVSELVKEGFLAPYQDFIYLVPVTKESEATFGAFLETQNQIVTILFSNEEVTTFLLDQPFIQEPLSHTEFIYKNFSVYLACLFYLNEQEYQLSKDHWQVLGIKRKRMTVPSQSKDSIIDLYQYLYQVAPQLAIFPYLEKVGWLSNQKLTFYPAFNGKESMNVPLMKTAIEQILVKEEFYQGSNLRCVILFDRIKKAVLEGQEGYLEYGLGPAFLDLKNLIQAETVLAAICGEFLIIDQEIYHSHFLTFQEYRRELQVSGYVYLQMTQQNRGSLLALTTQLLDSGKIHVLIGTVSLLGEGWNCPAINTIIMGNQAGSYVQTQQIRGRGLRKFGEAKLTNIWHIAPIIPNIPLSEQPFFRFVRKRLGFIEGLNLLDIPLISTGSERFELPDFPDLQTIANYTQHQLYQAKERDKHLRLWREALERGTHLSMPLFVRKQTSEKNEKNESSLYETKNSQRQSFVQAIITGNLLAYFQLKKKRKQWQKYCQMQQKLVETNYRLLVHEGILNATIPLNITWDDDRFSCEIIASYYQEKIFNGVVKETLGAVDDPRYLLKIGTTYFALPARYGKNKNDAQSFVKEIKKSYPSAEIHYTKNLSGRKHLMNARMNSLLTSDQLEIKEQKLWH